MVKKTRRKHSAVKRVKTAKRRKNNTRSKRGRGGRGGRSAKRGGMPLTAAARVAARSAAAAAKHAQRIHTPYGPLYGVVPKTISEQFIDKEKETTSNPVEMAITGKGVGDNMEKSAYNEHRRELFANQTPARPHNPAYFSTPKRDSTLHDIHNYTPFRQPIDSTPAGPSSDLSSPPPPDLFVTGKSMSISKSPSFKRGFAPTIANPTPNNPSTRLDFENVGE